jgi:hypothetical protein
MPYQFDEHQSSQSTYFDIARGHFRNVQAVNLFGFNQTIGTTYETIANDGGGVLAYPSSAVQMSLVSTSAADTMSVLISGLDADYNQINETIALNGLTSVTTTASFLRINSAQITSSTNAGDITISNGGTEYAFIGAGIGITQALSYTVPAGAKLYINSVSFTSGTVNPNKYLLGRASLTTADGAVLNFWQSTWAVGVLHFDVPVPFVVNEKCDFQLQAKSSSSENEISAYVNAHLVIDE